jgi:IS5 family transposase
MPPDPTLEHVAYAGERIRAKVGHPFHTVKNLFRHPKTYYRGLAKNIARLLTLSGISNLMLANKLVLIMLRASATSNCVILQRPLRQLRAKG